MKHIISFRFSKIVTLVFLLLFAFFMVMCSVEHVVDGPDKKGLKEIEVKLRVSVPDMDPALLGTRASEISDMYVMTFDNTPPYTMRDAPQKCEIVASGTPNESYYVTKLKVSTAPRKVVIVANADSKLSVHGYTPDVTTLANVELLKTEDLAFTAPYITDQPELAPMVGEVTVSELRSGMVISDISGGTHKEVVLTRATAKFTIKKDAVSPPPNFEIMGASMGNAPRSGYIFAQPTIATSSNLYAYSSTSPTFTPLAGAVIGGGESEPLYSYEISKADGPFLILRAKYNNVEGYYRINVVNGTLSQHESARTYMDVMRNTWYTVEIKQVGNYGYSSVTEAINNRASNIEYTVTAHVPPSEKYEDAHDIITNGDYFLGVSNSTFIAYSDGTTPMGNMVATTLTHNATSTVTTGLIAVTGTGLNLESAATFNPGAATKKLDIAVSMTNAFTSGSITIKLGNLEKKIEVERRQALSFVAGVLDDFKAADYVTAMLAPPAPPATSHWMKFSASANGQNAVEAIINEGIYIVYDHNIVMSGGVRREEIVYLGTKKDGRVKALFRQPFLDGDGVTDNLQNFVTPYVGAFWKANQTGERLIRLLRTSVSPLNAIDGQWTAVVLAGESWIRLDKELSMDNTVWTPSGPVMSGNDMGFDAQYPVLGSATSVFGTVSDSSPNDRLYFRIGLKNAYTPTTIAPARYGLVLLVANGGSVRQRIWIRQGEGADYIMRPEDEISSGGFYGSGPNARPLAVKFSPYNLMAPAMGYTDPTNVIMVGNPHQGLAHRGGEFTSYPSQAGYMFLWNYNRQAFAPHAPATISNWISLPFTNFWTASDTETCPDNYRRVEDGDITTHQPAGNVAGSEIRQSLWSNPLSGATDATQNSIFGYYADGFFDRRMIVNGPGTSPGANSSVSASTRDVAYNGRLFYNTATFASLFFPAAGNRNDVGQLLNAGSIGSYWTATSVNATGQAWYSLFSPFFSHQNQQGSKSWGYSVRCVECALLTSVSLSINPTIASVGSTIYLTANVVSSSPLSGLRYRWEYVDGVNSYLLGVTTTNSFNTRVLKIGASHYKVTVEGCNTVSDNETITGTPPTMPEPDPTVPMYVGAFWRANEKGERVIHVPVGVQSLGNTGPWIAYVTFLDGRWGPNDGVILAAGDSPDPNIRTNNPGNPEAPGNLVSGNETFINGIAPVNGAITFRIGLQQTYNATGTYPARYAVVFILYGEGKWRRIFIRQGHDPDYVMRPGDAINSGGMVGTGANARPQARKYSPYNITHSQNSVTDHFNTMIFSGTPVPSKFVPYPSMAGYMMTFNRFWGNPAVEGLTTTAYNASQLGTNGWWSANPAETCPNSVTLSYGGSASYRRPHDGTPGTVATPATVIGSEMRQSLWLNPQLGQVSLSNAANSVGGFYADGYFDRGSFRNGDGQFVIYYNPTWNPFYPPFPPDAYLGTSAIGDRVFTATAGRLFFNPETNASLFFPANGVTTAVNQAVISDVGTVGGYRTTGQYGNASTSLTSVLFFNVDPTGSSSVTQMQETPGVTLYSIRCVVP